MSNNKPEILLEGLKTPVMEVSYAAIDGEKPLTKVPKYDDRTQTVAPHNKITFIVDADDKDFNTFVDTAEQFGVLTSVSDLVVEGKRVKGKKKLTIKTFKVGTNTSLAVVDKTGAPITDKFIDTRVDKVTAQAVVKVILYKAHNTLSLELEAVIIHDMVKGERTSLSSMSEAAAEVVAKLTGNA